MAKWPSTSASKSVKEPRVYAAQRAACLTECPRPGWQKLPCPRHFSPLFVWPSQRVSAVTTAIQAGSSERSPHNIGVRVQEGRVQGPDRTNNSGKRDRERRRGVEARRAHQGGAPSCKGQAAARAGLLQRGAPPHSTEALTRGGRRPDRKREEDRPSNPVCGAEALRAARGSRLFTPRRGPFHQLATTPGKEHRSGTARPRESPEV